MSRNGGPLFSYVSYFCKYLFNTNYQLPVMQKNRVILGVLLLMVFLCMPAYAQHKSHKPAAKSLGNSSAAKEKKQDSNDANTQATVIEEPDSEETAIEAPVVEEDRVFTVVEHAAEFPGGATSMSQFLTANLKYPKAAKKANITGKVYTKFLVEKDGRISEVQIVKGLGHGCDEEAERVIKAMPTWKPASQRGRVVRSYYVLQVPFERVN